MTWPRGERLYRRLPELYRRRDLENGEPLRALLAVVESQLELLEDDVAGLYENWFLETCQDWAVPYLADLLGIRALGQPPHAGAHPRTQVGRVFDYRRRKGTPVALERVTRDVTGWFARVVELFEFLAHTQNVGHVRPGRGGLFDVRRPEAVARAEDPFAPPELFHTVDVRRIASLRGRFNAPNLALYVWRLQAFSIEDGPAVPSGEPGGFLFDPLGRDMQLFNRPETPEEIVRRSEERHLPVPLRPEIVAESLEDYYGSARAFEVRVDGAPVPPDQIVIADLSVWTAPAPAPAAGQVAVDPHLGRILFGTAPSGEVRVTWAYGFAAEMGGGPYDRRATLADPASAGFYREVSQSGTGTPLADAVAAWAADTSALGVIRVVDSEIYDDDDLIINLAPGRTLVLEAADGARPVLIPGTFRVLGAGPGSGLTINGFLIDAGLEIEGSLDLQVTHTTFVPQPGRGSLAHILGDPAELDVRVTFSIVGALRLPGEIASLRLEDSILDAETSGAGATPLPALVSGPLTDPLSLSTRLELSATLDGEAPRTVRLQGVPANPAQAAQLLQDALRAASSTTRFTAAQVVAVGGRLLVRSGNAGEAVSFGPTAADSHTVQDLELTTPPARFVAGLLSGGLTPFPAFSTLQVRATLGGDGPYVAILPGVPADLDQAAALLQQAIRSARSQPVFTQAAVVRLDDRLLVRPGVFGAAVAFAGTAADPQTASDFRLLPDPDPAVTSRRVEGVFSGFFDPLAPFPVFPGPEVEVTIDGETRTALLNGPMATPAEVASTLQAAIRAAAPALPLFANARVDLVGSQLLVRPGVAGEEVSFAASIDDSRTAGDLLLTAPPAETIPDGRLSTSLATFPDFRLRLRISIGGDQRDVTLVHLPDSLGMAQSALQAGIRAAGSGTDAFASAEVLLLGDRLYIRSGGASVAAATLPSDTFTAGDLGLIAPPAESLPAGLLSSPIGAVPVFQLPAVGVSFGGGEVRSAPFTSFPHTLAEAGDLLQEALRNAGTEASFTGAVVAVAGDRLMIASGVPDEEVAFSPVGDDSLTAGDLGLVSPPAENKQGLLSGDLFPFPVLFQPSMEATIGSIGPRPVVLDRVPATLAEASDLLEAALHTAHNNALFTAAAVDVIGTRLLVRPGIAGETVSFQASASDPNTVGDLSLTQPPARRVRGLLSGTVTFPAFSRPQVQVTMTVSGVPDGPYVATLSGLPVDLDQARSMLEAAVRAARPSAPAFASATVVRVGNRLVVQPGLAGALVTVAAAPPNDSTTAAELGLIQPPAVTALVSGDLGTFPTLPLPRVAVTLGAAGPRTAQLASLPTDLATARSLLEAAIQAADPGAAFTGAHVEVLGDSLLVLSGNLADTVTVTAAAGDSTTAGELGLTAATGTAVTGLSSGSLSPFPTITAASPKMDATLGGVTRTVTLSAKPTSLANAASLLEAALQAAAPPPTFAQARVLAVGSRLLVLPGVTGDAVSFAAATGDATTVTELKLDAASAQTAQGLRSAALNPFPALTIAPAVSATLGGVGPRTASFTSVPATLADARTALEAALRATLPADPAFSGATVQVLGSRLLVQAGGSGGSVSIANAAGRPTTATDLKLTAAAGALAGLVSSDLTGFAGLTIAPRIVATFGAANATARFSDIPDDLSEAASLLQAALRAASAAPTFTGAAVEVVDTRLLVTPGVDGDAVAFANPASGPPTADRLALTPAQGAISVDGLLSGDTSPFGITIPPLAVTATFGADTRTVDLGGVPSDVADLAVRLQAALRAGTTLPTFTAAEVLPVDDRILVLPGESGDRAGFSAAPASPDVVTRLKLDAASSQPVSGLLSGSLASFQALSMEPAVDATIGTQGPLRVLLGLPQDLTEAAQLLEAGLRSYTAFPTFLNARVRLLGDRLLVTGGVATDAVVIQDPPRGPATATLLGLSPSLSTEAAGLLGAPPASPFTMTLVPRLEATFGTDTRLVSLADLPLEITQARDLLERALLTAGFSGATVRVLGDRLLVRSGNGAAVSFTDAPSGAPAASRLGLAPGEPGDGLLSGSLDGFTGLLASLPALDVTLAGQGPYRATLAHAPVDLADARTTLETALRNAHGSDTFQHATVTVVGRRLLVTPGIPLDSIVLAPAVGREGDLARLELDPPSLVPADGLLSGDLSAFSPRLLPELQLTYGATTYNVALSAFPADLASAASLLQQALRGAGPFGGAVVEAIDDRLLVSLGVAGTFSFAPTANDPSTAVRLRLDAAQAVPADGLLSGDLSAFPRFAGSPALLVQIGDEGPYRAALSSIPADLADARTAVERAIRSAHNTAAFTLARVALTTAETGGERRLVVLPGRPGRVVVTPPAEDPSTAGELKLELKLTDPAQVRPLQVRALLSGELGPTVSLPGSPAVHAAFQSAVAAGEDFDAALSGSGGSLAVVAADLQAAIRGTGTSPAADQAWVAQVGTTGRLVAVPGADGFSIGLSAAANDSETVVRLGFEVGRAVGTGLADEEPGPPLRLERVTVLGHVFIHELPHASAALFSEPLRVERRHVGCVRYSYLPDGSETPRRFRCQPDLALALAIRRALDKRARELGLTSAAGLSAEEQDAIAGRERTRVLARLEPRFTSTRFGDPGYAQLAAGTALEILTGAEDGSEMGAFSRLQEPLRRSQLATLIEEYLRFGLDAGIFYVT